MWKIARQLVKHAEDIIVPEPGVYTPDYGFRVLYVEPGSPAAVGGLESLFDYIVAVDGVSFRAPPPTAAVAVEAEVAPVNELTAALGANPLATLTVWSAKGKTTRQVELPVRETDDGFGLGAEVQWTALDVADHVWHILNVTPGSAADEAGLLSHADYIVGIEDGMLEQGGEALLGRVVNRIAGNPNCGGRVRLTVYNHEYDTTRPVTISPRVDAAGNYVLGCGVGYGLLHRLPQVEKPDHTHAPRTMAPGDTLFDAEGPRSTVIEEGEEVVFSPLAAPAPPLPTGQEPQAPGPRRSRPAKGRQADLSSYFEEQTALSHEVDGWRRGKGDAPAPPPHAS